MGEDQKRPDSAGGEVAAPDIPDHELLRRIGRGSYGDVWLARNLLGAYRAVKVIHRGRFSNARPFERELAGIRRYEPVSRHHGGLVDVLHIGTNQTGDHFYYVMELADDVDSGQVIDPVSYRPKTLHQVAASQGRLSADASLELGLALTSALGFLHKNGLVHRDVKPSNIVFVNDEPKLADIGLVAAVDDARSYVGTEGFIPPEGPGTPQADCYSLGKVLYEISTGKDRHDFPELPTHLDLVPDRDRLLELNEITLRACKTSIAERYATAVDMHADLLVVCNGKSVRRLRHLETQLTRLKRVAAVAAMATLVVAGVIYHFYREFSFQAEQQQREVGTSLGRATALIDTGNYLQALTSLGEALRLDRWQNLREHQIRFTAVREQCPTLVRLLVLPSPVYDLDFSPDGSRLAVARDDGLIEIYDVTTGETVTEPMAAGAVLCKVSFDRSGGKLLSVDSSARTTIRSTLTGKVEVEFNDAGLSVDARFSSDGSRVVTACRDGTVRVWDVGAPETPSHILSGHTGGVLSVAFSPDDRYIASGGKDRTVIIWDAASGRRLETSLVHDNWVSNVNFSPDSSRIVASVSGSRTRTKAVVWDVLTARKIQPELWHDGPVSTAEYSSDGLFIVSSTLIGGVHLWDAASLLPVPANPVIKHGAPVRRVRFAPDSRRLATASGSQVWVWDLAGAQIVPGGVPGMLSKSGVRRIVSADGVISVFNGVEEHPAPSEIETTLRVTGLELNYDGTLALLTGERASVTGHRELWSLPEMSRLAFSGAPDGVTNQVVLGPRGSFAARLGSEEIEILNTARRESRTLPLGPSPEKGLFSPDERLFAVTTGGIIRVFETDRGEEHCEPLQATAPVSVMAFSPDSRLFAASAADHLVAGKAIVVWDLQSGRRIGVPLLHADGVLDLSFSPDSRSLVSGSEDGTAVLWNPVTGEALEVLEHLGQVKAVAFNAAGNWVATISSDRTARLWDVASGEYLTPPLPHDGHVAAVSFTATGKELVTADQQGLTWSWPLKEDLRPVEDLELLAGLLNGFSNLPSRQNEAEQRKDAQAQWRYLQSKYPQDFKVSEEEIVQWHLARARHGLDSGRLEAVEFHLRKVLEIKPADPQVREMFAEVQGRADPR